jgi:hypothetical protein
MYPRLATQRLQQRAPQFPAILTLDAQQTGKTTLV